MNAASSRATRSSLTGCDVLHPLELGRCCLDEGGHAVGECGQPRVVRSAVDEAPDVEVQPTERLVLDLHTLDRHEGRHFLGHLGRDEDPAVALDLDQPLEEAELAHPVEVGDRLGRQRQAVAGCELRDPFAVSLAFADLGAQAAVDVLDRRRELRRRPPPAARAPATAARRRRPGCGSGPARPRRPRRSAGSRSGRARARAATPWRGSGGPRAPSRRRTTRAG